MALATISDLPPEVLHQILLYLPVCPLLRFAQTSRQSHAAAILALQNLELAILPRRMHGVLAFLNSSACEDLDSDFADPDSEHPSRNQLIITSHLPVPSVRPKASSPRNPSQPPHTPARYREKLFQLQNAIACDILATPSVANLCSLTLHIYHIDSPALTKILATHLPGLRRLRLNAFHPYLHDTCLPAQYWTSPVFLLGSPIWNSLAGLGAAQEKQLKLRKLEKLTLERAGITSVQLRKWVEKNPGIKELRLRNVAGVDDEFVRWLGKYHADAGASIKDPGPSKLSKDVPVKLRALTLEYCSSLSLKSAEDFGFLDSLFAPVTDQTQDEDEGGLSDATPQPALRIVSFQGSTSVSTPSLIKYLETYRPALRQITMPDSRILVERKQKRTHSQLSTPTSTSGSRRKKSKLPNLQFPIRVSRSASSLDLPDLPDLLVGGEPHYDAAGIDNAGVHTNVSSAAGPANGGDDPGPRLGIAAESDDSDSEPESPSPVSYLRSLSQRDNWRGYERNPHGRAALIEPDPHVV